METNIKNKNDIEKDRDYVERIKRSRDPIANIELILRHLHLFTGLVAERAIREKWSLNRITSFYDISESEAMEIIEDIVYDDFAYRDIEEVLEDFDKLIKYVKWSKEELQEILAKATARKGEPALKKLLKDIENNDSEEPKMRSRGKRSPKR